MGKGLDLDAWIVKVRARAFLAPTRRRTATTVSARCPRLFSTRAFRLPRGDLRRDASSDREETSPRGRDASAERARGRARAPPPFRPSALAGAC
jgi:hypothetical protein